MMPSFPYRLISPQVAGHALLCLLSAVLLVLSFPSFHSGFLAWVALVPFFLALQGASVKRAMGLSFLTGLAFFMGVFRWITAVSGFAWYDFVLAGIYMASFIALFGLVLSLVSKNHRVPFVITAPALWVSIEYLRSHFGMVVLPWALLGHSQYLNLPVIQIASLTGVYGISFLLVMVNVALAQVVGVYARRWWSGEACTREHSTSILKSATAALAVLLLSVSYGFMTLSDERPSATTRIAVIQGNLPQEIRGRPDFRVVNVQNHVRLTEDAIRSTHPSLIIWPEVAAQGSFRLDLYLNQTIARLAQTTHTYFLIGSAERPKYGQTPLRTTKSFNSAFLVSPQGRILGQYNKLHLLPFSEYLPYEEVIPWPARYRASTAYFTPGREYTVFQLDDLRFGTTICWEAIFPDMFRRFVGQGVDFMVNITNEVLFGETAAPHQFLSMVVFRAVENHVAIARSAYTGVSGFIDPQGRIIGTVNRGGKETFVEGHLTAALPLSRQRTFYTAYGDVFAYLCQAAVALAFLRRVALTRRALTGNRAPQSL